MFNKKKKQLISSVVQSVLDNKVGLKKANNPFSENPEEEFQKRLKYAVPLTREQFINRLKEIQDKKNEIIFDDRNLPENPMSKERMDELEKRFKPFVKKVKEEIEVIGTPEQEWEKYAKNNHLISDGIMPRSYVESHKKAFLAGAKLYY